MEAAIGKKVGDYNLAQDFEDGNGGFEGPEEGKLWKVGGSGKPFQRRHYFNTVDP